MISHEVKSQDTPNEGMKSQVETKPPYKMRIVWGNVLGYIVLHLLGLYGLYLSMTGQIYWKTLMWTYVVGYCSFSGITIGAHRLFSHRAFTASLGLKLFLLAMQTMAGQNCAYIWARDHRQHHKYNDTDADPHNSKRGLFFSHLGWLMVRKHPDVIANGKTIDMSDLEADPYVMFQKNYYQSLYFTLAVALPVIVPCMMWEENLWNSFLVCYFLRYTVTLHMTWAVNSFAHFFGARPYNKNIRPRENLIVTWITSGEGYHNFHHQFPWDYQASELGMKLNLNTHYINFFAKLGMVKNLRTVSDDFVIKTIEKHGDGSHHLWGFGDSDMNPELHKVLKGNEGDASTEARGASVTQLDNGTKPLTEKEIKQR